MNLVVILITALFVGSPVPHKGHLKNWDGNGIMHFQSMEACYKALPDIYKKLVTIAETDPEVS